MDGRGEHVIRRLAEVHMVVRMDACASQGGHHLVRVHIRRGAGASLEDVDRKLVVELACGNAVARGSDALREPWIEKPEVGVGPGGRGLDASEPVDDSRGNRLAGNRKICDCFRRFAAPELVRHRLAHRFYATCSDWPFRATKCVALE